MNDNPVFPTKSRVGSTMDPARPGISRSDVRHVCPWCGGRLAEAAGALLVVQLCWACQGQGDLSTDELSAALRLEAFGSQAANQ